MARKLTIRRVGGLLPAICLMVLILLATVFIWLSTAGLPDCALRRIEAEAAKEGIHLKVGKIKLAPASGLAVRARKVELYATAEKQQKLASLERATAGISLTALLRGKLVLTMAEFRELNVDIPTDGAGALELRHATASARIRNGNYVRLTSASANLQGVPINVQGAFLLPEGFGSQDNSGESTPLDLPALLQPWQEVAGRIRRSLAAQEWTPDTRPSIELNLIDLRKTQLSALISIPRYDEEQFHFRDTLIDIGYQDKILLINNISFRTIDPDSKVTLQGGYDIEERHLSVNLDSTAALTRMAESAVISGIDTQNLVSWLHRFQHPDNAPPAIKLRGDVYFEEDYTLKSVSLLGQVELNDFIFGKTAVDELELSFFYRDGSFNIDRLHLGFPGGTVQASASASAKGGRGKASIRADLDVPRLLGFVSEFTAEPLSLPEGLELDGNLQLALNAQLDIPKFIAGSRQLRQFIPRIHRVELALGIPHASCGGCAVANPLLSLNLGHFLQGEDEMAPHGLEEAQLTLKADALTLPLAEEGKAVQLGKMDLALELRQLLLGLQPNGEGCAPSLDEFTGSLKLGTVELPDFKAQALELEIAPARGLRPLAQDWRQILSEAAIRFSTGAMHTGDMLLGAMDSRLTLNTRGEIDLDIILKRDGHSLNLDLHPQLTEEGLLVLEQVDLELPAAGFAPLLDLAGVNITQIRLPDTLTLRGNATYDTRSGQLRQANAVLDIPHIVRTPGDNNLAFKGEELPLSVHAEMEAHGKEGGTVDMAGRLAVTHKAGPAGHEDDRYLLLNYRASTGGTIHLEGTNTIDIAVIDQLIDLADAHMIMRDFRTNENTRLHIDINSVDIALADAVRVTASCEVKMSDFEYQMDAREPEKDANGTPTGREPLRRDFGKNPFRRIERMSAHVDVLYDEDSKGEMEACTVTISKADLTYDNRQWMNKHGFKGGERSSRLQGDAVIIDIQEGFVELKNVHGRVYPAYSIGAFYDELPVFMEDFILPVPCAVETEHCLFPIYSECKRPMSGCIRLMAPRAEFRFLGTTFPFTMLSGFIWLTDGAVKLDSLNAACWNGAINAAVVIDYSGKHTGFDGFATVSNINLQPLAASYGSKQQPALCNGQIRFRTPSTELNDLQAYGEVHIVDGDLMTLSLFKPVGELIADLPGNLAALEESATKSKGSEPSWLNRQVTKVFRTTGKAIDAVGDGVSKVTDNIPFANHFLRYDLQEVHSNFTIGRGYLRTQGMKALGFNLNVGMDMALNLDKLTVRGDFWPKISSVPTVILSPLTFLSDFMIDIQVYGPVDDIDWKFGLNRIKPGEKVRSVTCDPAEHQMESKADKKKAKAGAKKP